MTDIRKEGKGEAAGKKRPRIGRLEINKETIENLTEEQAEAARGGAAGLPTVSTARAGCSNVCA